MKTKMYTILVTGFLGGEREVQVNAESVEQAYVVVKSFYPTSTFNVPVETKG